jgi:hypothetical protein
MFRHGIDLGGKPLRQTGSGTDIREKHFWRGPKFIFGYKFKFLHEGDRLKT